MSEVVRTEDSFYIVLAGSEKAVVKYQVKGREIFVISTYTPQEHRGKGIAEKLITEVIKFAEKENLKIVPICSYAKHYFEKHPELKIILA
ncbi:MAG: GNAT family N-acetyltransferase [Thermoproteota archaeon]